ncbi:jg14334 [Pararge aegeria aegeria]|uniref:Jg14334 protein n=1 Tax=Pararge aegeria aegeria TaxID=348720 RepID=A0A8S4R6F8_9NEOP|nr:jg14334 [Pararge aegeria aegeria]
MGLISRFRVTQRAMERAMLGVSILDQIRNVEIRRRTRDTNISSTSREAEVAMTFVQQWTSIGRYDVDKMMALLKCSS